MKKLIYALMFLAFASLANAQWQADLRLTNNSGNSYTSDDGRDCITANGNFIHVVWYDSSNGNNEIYYKRSPDGGISWGSDIRLTNNSSNSYNPTITVSGNSIHIVWVDTRDGNPEIYYKRSTNGGLNWETDTRLTNNTAVSYTPSLAVSDSVIHVIWRDDRDGNPEMYYKCSPDGGVSWGSDIRLTNNSAVSQSPTITVSNLFLHTVWVDFRDGNWEIYYKRSTDGGISWGTDTRLTNDPANSFIPSISVSGSAVHVVWEENRNGNYEVYYKRSPDNGVSWGQDTRLTNDPALSQLAHIFVSLSNLHVIWQDFRNSNFEIYYKRSTDGGISWGTDTRLTNDPAVSTYPSGAVSGQIVSTVWCDNRDGNYEIYYKRDPTGNPVRIKIISSEIPKLFILSQNYPNPFNPETNIEFSIPKLSFVQMKVFDILGREIETLISQDLKPGIYKVNWLASQYPSGIYFYKIQAADYTETKKMVLIK